MRCILAGLRRCASRSPKREQDHETIPTFAQNQLMRLFDVNLLGFFGGTLPGKSENICRNAMGHQNNRPRRSPIKCNALRLRRQRKH
jgi:hypothetical protein